MKQQIHLGNFDLKQETTYTLEELNKIIQDKIKSNNTYASTSEISIRAYGVSNYEETFAYLGICFTREETDKEYETRKKREQKFAEMVETAKEKHKEHVELKEKKLYLKLKAKFENGES